MHTTCLFHLKLMHSNHVFSVHCSRKLLWYNGFEFWHKSSFCSSLNSCNISETCFDHTKKLCHGLIRSFVCSSKVTNLESVWMDWSLANYGWLAQSNAPAPWWHSGPNFQCSIMWIRTYKSILEKVFPNRGKPILWQSTITVRKCLLHKTCFVQ